MITRIGEISPSWRIWRGFCRCLTTRGVSACASTTLLASGPLLAEAVAWLDYLGGKDIRVPLELTDCIFDSVIVLTKATAPDINLRGSRMRGLYGKFLKIAGALNIGGVFHCSGPIKLFAADIGEIEAEGGIFENPRGLAINADYLRVRSYANFERARILGTVRMLAVHIYGQIDFTSAELTSAPSENAIELDSAKLVGGAKLFCYASIDGGIWMVNSAQFCKRSVNRVVRTIVNRGSFEPNLGLGGGI